MGKLLIICGSTATGKTRLALYLAKVFSGELVSADSKQVYRGMNIGTGKELPPGSKYITGKGELPGYYLVNGVKIWGYDLVGPKEGFSVGEYLRITGKIMADIYKRKLLPILVGGTGLYIKAQVDGFETTGVPKNDVLRKTIEGRSVDDLYNHLGQLDSVKAASLNISDRKNPRRLIRAIEVAQWKIKHNSKKVTYDEFHDRVNPLFVGLKATNIIIDDIIEARVYKRIDQGFEKEVRNLINKGLSWNSQAMDSLGYKQWQPYFLGEETKKTSIDAWIRAEKAYAKRQMTWFKKDKRINWFDITSATLIDDVEKLVKRWYKD